LSIPRIKPPDDLVERDQWVLWRYENGAKVPYTTRGRKASSTDSATWAPFSDVTDLLQRRPNLYAGAGFVFASSDPFVGIDLDDSLDGDGSVKTWASSVVERFAHTYMEISPSCHGLKIWARGSLPANLPKVLTGDGGIELYDHARYFTLTGRVFRGAPLEIEDCSSDVLALYNGLTNKNKGRWQLQPVLGGRIPHGVQHSTLISIMGTLRARRVCDEAIEACLQIINERQCERPGPREHISRMVRSSRQWGATA
jgi:hypothetical protein